MSSFNRNLKRKSRVRHKLRSVASSGALRISVFRSNQHMYLQLIDDQVSSTLYHSSTLDDNFLLTIEKSGIDGARFAPSTDATTKKGAKKSVKAEEKGVDKNNGAAKKKLLLNCLSSYELGKFFAEGVIKNLKLKDKKFFFDRGGRVYHGRLAAVANGMRDGGLIF